MRIPEARMFCGKELEGRGRLQWPRWLWGHDCRTEAGGWYLPTPKLGKPLRCPTVGRQTTARPRIYLAWPAQECTPIPGLMPGVQMCQGNRPPLTYGRITLGKKDWVGGRGQAMAVGEGRCPQPGVREHSCHWPVCDVAAQMDGWGGAGVTTESGIQHHWAWP